MLVLKETNIKKNMNLKKEKGYVGIDLTTSVIVLMLLIPTVMALIYNLNLCNQDTERKGNAINFATNITEAIKGIKGNDFDQIEILATNKNLYGTLQAEGEYKSVLGSNIDITRTEESGSDTRSNTIIIKNIEDSKGVHYRATLIIEDYMEDENNNLVKTATVQIEYPLGKAQKKVSLSTVITKY